ncbi:hypothetical protein [Agrobacterium sp. M50-1]|uniref:hypothetical protein n=1 Tax=Agrobacterium sp. M50-1 TaxID=3132821 RepID=UPI003CE4A9DF
MQSEESNTLVKLAKAVIEHAPEGGDAFWDIKFSDIEAALSAAEPSVAVKADESPMRFFSSNVDNWGALEWFNRLVDACEDHDRKRTEAFRCADPDEKDMLSLSADTSKMIMSSSAFHLAREHKSEILSALTAQVQDVAGCEAERLRRMVERRDEFIIGNGLWDAFKEVAHGRD